MDRHSQYSASRPSDRMIQNPNHPPSAPPPPPQQQYYPSTASPQPPVHLPFSDPFRRSDPFLPGAHAQRRDAYAYRGGEGHNAPLGDRHGPSANWSSSAAPSTPNAYPSNLPPPPPPPPPPSSIATPTNGHAAMYGYDPTRRGSLGGSSSASPHTYAPPSSIEGPPAPPSFPSRHMPPPSPPQAPPPSFASHRPPPPPPQVPTGRDLPSLGSAHRPSSGFSISSILGGSRDEYPAWRQPQTPERIGSSSAPRPSESRSYSTSSSQAYGPPAASPEYNRPPLSLHRYSSSHSADRAPDIGGDGRSTHQPLRPEHGEPPRPNSQPTGPSGMPPVPRWREPLDEVKYRPPPIGPSIAEQRRAADEEHQRARSISDPRAMERDRPLSGPPLSGSSYSPPAHQRYGNSQYSPSRSVHHSPPERAAETSAHPNGRPREDVAVQSPYGGYRAHSALPPTTGLGHATSSSPQKTSYSSTPQPSYNDSRHSLPRQFPAPVDVYPGRPASGPERLEELLGPSVDHQPRSHPYDHPPSRIGEEMQQQRSYLNVSPESLRRQLGRASPLPQAVQGAQAQQKGPGADPSIKNEFGRMFSGLGSGLGSGPGGNGISTPSRGSPLPQARPDSIEGNALDADLQMVRSGSRGMKKNKRAKEEEGRADVEMLDRVGTPSGLKRAKHIHPTAHHHHPHHHHHHHHKAEDDLTSQPRGSTPNAFLNKNNASVTPALAQPGASKAPHHHHHHYPPHAHGHEHHHHHHNGTAVANTIPKAPTPVIAAPPPPPKRKTIINSRAVIDSVSHLPRAHLGSKLYTVSYELAPRSLTAAIAYNASLVGGTGERFGYTMKPEPMPKFDEDRANCTFTVRVPRAFLTPEKREEICRHRFLWGADVYTDDSDAVAAAMHAGWIRGEWSAVPGGDDELMELGVAGGNASNSDKDASSSRPRKQPAQAAPAAGPEMEIPTLMTEPLPAGPVVPPRDMDARITLLLLPPLQRYAAATRHGVRSRAWGGNHDGLSFAVHSVEWVDEGRWGGGLAEERGGKARRERLRVLAGERAKVERAIRAGREERRREERRRMRRRKLDGMGGSGAGGAVEAGDVGA